MRVWSTVGCSLAFLLIGSLGHADVVPPPPSNCPSGYTPETSHSGPYCRPPLPRCPRGYQPRIWERHAYCEPPPDHPCPRGAEWSSTSEDDAFCVPRMACQDSGCPAGQACFPTAFCLQPVCFRCSPSRIVGFCEQQEDCPGDSVCSRQRRCDVSSTYDEGPSEPTEYAKPPPGRSGTLELAGPDDGYQDSNRELPHALVRAEKSGGCAGCGLAGREASGTAAVIAIVVALALRRRQKR